MASVRVGSKVDNFKRQGQAWFCTSGLPSDITVEVGEMSFHLHKFPLLSRSGLMEKLISKACEDGKDDCIIQLPHVPGGAKAFELVAKFCYGVKLEVTTANVVSLLCAAEHLEMTEEYGEGNLIAQTDSFLNQVVLHNWKDTIRVLQTCDDVMSHAEDLEIVKKCIESLASKACTDPNMFGWPMNESGPMQSPGGSFLWNGISTGAKPRSHASDWWYEDVSYLSFRLYKRLISTMEARGIRQEMIARSLEYYAKRYLPGLNRRHGTTDPTYRLAAITLSAPPSEEEQKHLIEEINALLPMEKGLVSTKFLFGLLRTAVILHASPACLSNLEKRIGWQLDEATVDDLLFPNVSYSMETLYDVDCAQRILDDFLTMDQATGEASPGLAEEDQFMGSPSLAPVTMVAKLIDGFLAEIAPDTNLKMPKFQSLAATVPEYARPLDDGLYRAIDIYLKAHPWLAESEKEQLCRLMDCQKLSLEACTHAAQNERLPIRVVVQVLFFEQLQLRSSIAGCLLVSDNLDASRPLRSGHIGSDGGGGGWATAVRENQVLKVGMDNMRMRVAELEKECSTMKQEIEKLGKEKTGWVGVPMKFGLKMKSQMCSVEDRSVASQKNSRTEKDETNRTRPSKHKKKIHKDD